MNHPRIEHRRAVAAAARGVLDGTESFERFTALVAQDDYDDPLLQDLIDQVNHLAPRSRLFGLGETARAEHLTMIERLIAAAEA